MDRLDLGHDQMRLLLRDERADRGRVQHVQYVRTMRHLHGRRVGVAVGGDHFHAQPLQLDGYLLAQFARPEQQDTEGVGRQRRTERDHGRLPGKGAPV